MPFIRHTRDKRGFESLVVMHAYRPTPDSPHRTRVLYLFRSPINLKVGRQPLDDEVTEALEHTHPDLNFDWPALTRERARSDMQDRQARRQGPSRPSGGARPGGPADASVVARVAGPGEAAGLRRRYAELTERIMRRARTPEERDRLLERLRRLNPDEWVDETAGRTAFASVDADLAAISAELPGRRRGRRGGRRRAAAPGEPGPTAEGASAIMGGDETSHAGPDTTQVDWPDRDTGARGDGGGRDGADAPAESTEASGLHGDDRAHHD